MTTVDLARNPKHRRILFSLVHPGYLRNFDSSIRLLAERGHRVRLLFAHHRKAVDAGRMLLDEYATKYGIEYEARSFAPTFWMNWAVLVRSVRDYARYFRPAFQHATKLRDRAGEHLSAPLRILLSLPGVRAWIWGPAMTRLLAFAEAGIPPDPAIMDYFRQHEIDLLMVSPFVDIASPQTEYVKAAQALGIPTVLPVHSWDNLTNKGQIRIVPDLVAVWNHLQEREAIDIHGIAPERIVVTGAQAYDHWFGWKASGREEFCGRIGLDPARPYFLYVGSSGFIAAEESTFASSWIRRVRSAANPVLHTAGILIRPYPQNPRAWDRFKPERFGDVVVYPRNGSNPMNPADKQDYFDSIFHAAAIVGVNTSALIDQLTRALQPDDEETRERADRFVKTFIRPCGTDVAGTPRLVAAIERVAGESQVSVHTPSTVSTTLFLLPALLAWSIPRPTKQREIDLASLPKDARRVIKAQRRERRSQNSARVGARVP
jgi:hypothetical protein